MSQYRYFDPMAAIHSAVRMFMEEHPEDALDILLNAQKQYFECLQIERMKDAIEDEIGDREEWLDKQQRRGADGS